MNGDELRLRAERGDAEGLSLALSGGVNPCSRDPNGLTALHVAVWNGHIECVKVLCANDLGIDDFALSNEHVEEEQKVQCALRRGW